MKKLTKKKKIIIFSSLSIVIALGITLGICIPLVLWRRNNSVETASPINLEEKELKKLKFLNDNLIQSIFSDLRNYFIHQNTLSLLSLKKIKSIGSSAFVGVGKNDSEQIQSIIMPEHEINFGIDSLDKKNGLNYLPNLQKIYVSKNQNLSQYKEIGFLDKIKFWN